MKRSINRTHTHSLGRQYPNGLIYRRACEMMGIDPDNNPNFETEGDKVIIPKEQFRKWSHNNFPQFFTEICKRLKEF